MRRKKKLNIIKRKRENTRENLLDKKARKVRLARQRALNKRLIESRIKSNQEFWRNYKEMLNVDRLNSSLDSVKGIGTKKKSVLE